MILNAPNILQLTILQVLNRLVSNFNFIIWNRYDTFDVQAMFKTTMISLFLRNQSLEYSHGILSDTFCPSPVFCNNISETKLYKFKNKYIRS